ncbi:MAG: DUF2059 domain-containing protein [Deltaproteobacteria bacterium]|nr:DUF2059 domain-containing protein [Deltaproteobacteria bacterium]NCP02498.1 DUF2059 domain-containing protein [Deltaproteobacteria bacterium]NCP77769.1 DUF2059 domain-containing protein [Desulfuromonadales bacterium]
MLKTIIGILCFLVFAPVLCTAAEPQSSRQLAEEFLMTNKVKEQVDLMYQKVEDIIFSQIEAIDISEEREKNLQALQKISRDLLYENLSWEKLKEEYIQLYTETFTREELAAIVDFSRSPLGQKMAEKSPILMQRSMEIGRARASAVMPKIQQSIQDYMKENVKQAQSKEGQAPIKQ